VIRKVKTQAGCPCPIAEHLFLYEIAMVDKSQTEMNIFMAIPFDLKKTIIYS